MIVGMLVQLSFSKLRESINHASVENNSCAYDIRMSSISVINAFTYLIVRGSCVRYGVFGCIRGDNLYAVLDPFKLAFLLLLVCSRAVFASLYDEMR